MPVEQARMPGGLPVQFSALYSAVGHARPSRLTCQQTCRTTSQSVQPVRPRDWGRLGKIQGGRCVPIEQVRMPGGGPVHELALRVSIDCHGQLCSR